MALESKVDKAIQDLRTDCECEKATYCPLALLMKLNPRTLEQHKMVEYFKLIRSEEEGKDLGWERAYQEWVEKGWAKRFAEVYSEDKSYRQMRKELFSK